jgi:hypothetical protein
MYSDNLSNDEVGAVVGLFLLMLIPILIGTLIVYVISSWFLARIFAKAGIEQWIAWVPIYNTWKFLELGGQKGWLSLLVLIPYVGGIVTAIYLCIAAYNIGRGFGKESSGWVVLYALVTLVWYGIIAFDDSRWNGIPSQPVISGSFGNEKDINDNLYNQQ